MGEIRAAGAVHVPARSYLLARNHTSTFEVCAERSKNNEKGDKSNVKFIG